MGWRAAAQKLKPAEIDGALIVSLTSYPPRFGTLAYTLKSLLAQSLKPDRIILWIAHGDRAALPKDVLDLEQRGLEIAYCENLRSYKKIVFALHAYPKGLIAIADDDTYYWRDWLKGLVAAYDPKRRRIPCYRAHRIVLRSDGRPAAYTTWQHNIGAPEASSLIFATGMGGVLYPADFLHPDVLSAETFSRLAPTADDVWLYWMARLGGSVFYKVGPRRRFHNWNGSQNISLYDSNALNNDANDVQIDAMMGTYGWANIIASPPSGERPAAAR
jgi:hypothetical protein